VHPKLYPNAERNAALSQPDTATCHETLVFAIGDREAARVAAKRFSRNEAPNSALEILLAYVDQHWREGAALIPLYPERAETVLRASPAESAGPASWEIAVPDLRSRSQALSAFHYLRLASPGPRALLEKNTFVERTLREAALLTDPAITYVHRPVAQRPHKLRPDTIDTQPRLWGMEKCGFLNPGVREFFKDGTDPGPIAMVDIGGHNGHDDLRPAITKVKEPSSPSDSDHASVVAGVLAARRGLCDMEGCCGAHVHLYNVFDAGENLDCLEYYSALKAIAADSQVCVVNLSLQLLEFDKLAAEQVAECIRQKKILVAAMGNTGNKPGLVYPAAYDDVIAVGALNQELRRKSDSTIGDHILLSAPGEYIFSVAGRKDCDKKNHGTSFAAPMVSAAVWLALSVRPKLGLGRIKSLLVESTVGDGVHSREVGWGLLNMPKMVDALKRIPK
jgi:hypothetical protein